MSQLPEKFRVCFWDSDFDVLDIKKNKAFIISRLYTKGGFPGIFWVEEKYSCEDIIYAAKTRRDLDPIVANYLRNKIEKFIVCTIDGDLPRRYRGCECR